MGSRRRGAPRPTLVISLIVLGAFSHPAAEARGQYSSAPPTAVEDEVPPEVGDAAASMLPPAEPGRALLPVPFVGQTELMCGAAAVVMSLRYWGDDEVDPENFRDLVIEEARGIRGRDLVSRVRELGWEAVAFEGSLDLVGHHVGRARPVTALIELAPGRRHFVTIVGLVGDDVVYHDPAVSPYQRVSRAEFDALWSRADRWTALIVPGGSDSGDRSISTGSEPSPASGESRPVIPLADSSGRHGQPRVDELHGPAASSLGIADSSANVPWRRECPHLLDLAAGLAGQGDLVAADSAIASAERHCPTDPHVMRERAALLLRQGEHARAVAVAERSLASNPTDGWGREILAASRYLDGDDEGALDEWHRLGRTRLGHLELVSPTRTRHDVIARSTGLQKGEPITGGDLRQARFRLATLPTATATRVGVRPLPDGRISAEIGVAERPLVADQPADMALMGVTALVDRELRLDLSSPTRSGELWTLEWRWQRERRGVSLNLALPGYLGDPGVWSIAGGIERETYASSPAQSGPVAEDRRFGRVEFSSWLSPDLQWRATLGLDRWTGAGLQPMLSLAAGVGSMEGPADGSVSLSAWSPGTDAGGFARGDAVAHWRPVERPAATTVAVVGGAAWASSEARRSVWPGAGTGYGRPALIRAHPLLANAVIDGPLFGRGLTYAGVEATRWLEGPPLVDLGLALFVDAAYAWSRAPSAPGSPFHLDAGIGARLGLPGSATLRLDHAVGLRDGARAWSVSIGRHVPFASSY